MERDVAQVKWQIHLHNDWVEGAAENVSVSGVGFTGEGCLSLYLHRSPEGPSSDEEQQITVC